MLAGQGPGAAFDVAATMTRQSRHCPWATISLSARERESGEASTMADHTPQGPVELGAAMDYKEHEGTYSLFLTITKYTSLVVIALLIAMTFGFFTSAGFFSATVLFVLICAVGTYFLR
jgi:hypothetical protein